MQYLLKWCHYSQELWLTLFQPAELKQFNVTIAEKIRPYLRLTPEISLSRGHTLLWAVRQPTSHCRENQAVLGQPCCVLPACDLWEGCRWPPSISPHISLLWAPCPSQRPLHIQSNTASLNPGQACFPWLVCSSADECLQPPSQSSISQSHISQT